MKIVVPRGAEAHAVRRSGAGAVVEVRAGAASAAVLPAFAAGETVVVMGLCGALRGLRAGDVVVYARIAGDAHAIELDRGLIDAVLRAVPQARVVSACTADRVVTYAAERRTLAARYDADVVDMEALHLAAALAARGVRFAMVRTVSDDAARDLPPLGDAVDPDGRVRMVRIAVAFARAPRDAFAFVRNVRAGLAALRAVAHALAGVAE